MRDRRLPSKHRGDRIACCETPRITGSRLRRPRRAASWAPVGLRRYLGRARLRAPARAGQQAANGAPAHRSQHDELRMHTGGSPPRLPSPACGERDDRAVLAAARIWAIPIASDTQILGRTARSALSQKTRVPASGRRGRCSCCTSTRPFRWTRASVAGGVNRRSDSDHRSALTLPSVATRSPASAIGAIEPSRTESPTPDSIHDGRRRRSRFSRCSALGGRRSSSLGADGALAPCPISVHA